MKQTRGKHNAIWAVGLTLWLGAIPAVSQQAPPSPLPGVFGEVLDVRVVNLEVVVTDRDGVPILGLKPQDFELTVDGAQVPIDYFSEVRGGLAVATGEGAVGIPALAPGEPVGTSYLLFIDDFFTVAADRDRILEGIVEDLPLLRPEDRMAVVAYDGRKPEMLSSWSSEVATLERVLKRARERPALGLHRIAERRQFSLDENLLFQDLIGPDTFGGGVGERFRVAATGVVRDQDRDVGSTLVLRRSGDGRQRQCCQREPTNGHIDLLGFFLQITKRR